MSLRTLFFTALSLLSLSVFAQQKELQILTASPNGELQSLNAAQQIVVTFNEPMTALQTVPIDSSSGPMMIEPYIKGKFRWLGTSVLTFTPENPLPYATAYTVKIPAGTQSLSGKKLQKEFSWTFFTPIPKITAVDPTNGATHIDTNRTIILTFNQPVDASTAAQKMSIALKHPDYPFYYPKFTVRRASAADSMPNYEHKLIVAVPTGFPMGSEITVTVKGGLKGIEGPLPMSSDFSTFFTTFGELRFLGITEQPNSIYPQTGITLKFTNGVTSKELMNFLSIAPVIKSREEYYENTYPSQEIFIPLPLQAESTYIVTLKPGVKDQFGNTLKNGAVFAIKVQPYLPFVRMKTGLGVLEGYESHKFPITSMNMESYTVQMGEVNPEQIVPLMQKLSWGYYEKLAFTEGLLLSPSSLSEDGKAFTHSKTIKTRAKKNTLTVRPLDLDVVLGKKQRGVVLIQLDDMNNGKNAYLKSLVQVTNFGITAKFSPESNLIWVTNLKDATPVAQASVELRNDSNIVVWKGLTDEKGLVKTPGWGKFDMKKPTRTYSGDEGEYSYEDNSSPRQWVIVKKNNDIAYTSSEWNDGIQPWRFDISEEWNPQPEKIEGTLFTDRGLYKAGESVGIKGILRVRKESTWKISTTAKTRLVVRNSRGEEVYNSVEKLSSFGSFAVLLPLKPSAPLGYYDMQMEIAKTVNGKERWESIQYASFRVEAFRAAEFEVTAKFNNERYIIGDTVSGFFNAKYLFGAPMKNDEIRWRMSASRTSFTPPGFENYYFGKMNWLTRYQNDYFSRMLEEQVSSLDDFGALPIKAEIKTGEIQGTISLMIEGDVTSPSRQTLSGRASVIVHGGEYYIGIRPSSTFVKSDSAMNISLIASSPDGVLLPNQKLTTKIFQRVWHSVRKAETGGRFSWVSTSVDTMVDSTQVTTTASPQIHTFIPKEPGFYYIDVQGKDSRGNELVSNAYFYASGSGYVAWERTNDDRIELIANKKDFKPGETANIIVKNPYEKAVALVTVEREGIIKHFTTTLTGSAPQIDLPITSDFLPNVFVSVVLLQGRTDRPTAKEEADVGRPSFKVGYVALSVNPKEKKLSVSTESNKKEYRPGDTVEVTITVKDETGKPKRAEVSLSVADLGVLNLISYRLPNPFDNFYRERGLAVVTTETRMHIIEQRSYDEKGQEVGGGGAAKMMASDVDADGIRKDFRPSAYWNPSIATDAKGIAVVKFKLPDNLTAFQMMAVAQTLESDFGFGENSFTVNKPLLLQPSLPRFVRVGDTFKSGVVVMNYSDKPQTIILSTAVTGVQWDVKDSSVTQTLESGQAKEILFTFTASKIGSAKFVFRAKSGNEYDGLQWTIPVSAPRLKESVALFESITDPSIDEAVIPPNDAYGDIGDVEFTSSSTALSGLSGGISYLFSYPYGCLEQRSSAVLPMIIAKDLVDAFKFDVLKDKDYRAVVSKTLDEIPLFQQSSGGFSYWKNDWRTSTYVSAYAMYTLAQAQKNGYSIDKHAFEQGLEYLKRVLRNEVWESYYSKYEKQNTRALILYTMALVGKAEFGYMENLYNERNDMPLFAKAYLLKALHNSNGNQSMQDELARDLFNRVKVAPTTAHFEEPNEDQLWWCFSSTTRTTALVMQALTETQPENNIIPKVVRWLLDQQKAGRWRTTQENLYVVDALATYLRVYEKEEPNFRGTIVLEGKTILEQLFKGRSFTVAKTTVPFTELTLGKKYSAKINKNGTGRMYYGIRMNYFPKGETLQKDEGFSVVKTMETVDGKPISTFEPGMIVKITLTVSSRQDRHFVAVEDPVPAGFEIVNTSFSTTAANLDNEEGESGRWYEQAFNHKEKYDDKVILFSDYFTAGAHTYSYLAQVTRSGMYQLPATRVEGMYEPEVFGQTASSVVHIK